MNAEKESNVSEKNSKRSKRQSKGPLPGEDAHCPAGTCSRGYGGKLAKLYGERNVAENQLAYAKGRLRMIADGGKRNRKAHEPDARELMEIAHEALTKMLGAG